MFHAAVMFCRNMKSQKVSFCGHRLWLGESAWLGDSSGAAVEGTDVTSLNIVVYTAVALPRIHSLKPSGHYMYRQFNIQQLYVLSTQCIYVFCVDLRTNSHYFPIQHTLTGLYNRDLTLYSPVVTICTTSLTFNNSTLCPHSVFMCFVWISEQTAFISLYNIN